MVEDEVQDDPCGCEGVQGSSSWPRQSSWESGGPSCGVWAPQPSGGDGGGVGATVLLLVGVGKVPEMM